MPSHQFTFDTVLTRNEGLRSEYEIEVTVIYTVSPFIAATYWQPAEGGEVEIVSVKHNGAEIETSRVEDDRLYDLACDRADQDVAEWRAEYGEYLADQRREASLVAQGLGRLVA